MNDADNNDYDKTPLNEHDNSLNTEVAIGGLLIKTVETKSTVVITSKADVVNLRERCGL